jgi:hypothetical protein
MQSVLLDALIAHTKIQWVSVCEQQFVCRCICWSSTNEALDNDILIIMCHTYVRNANRILISVRLRAGQSTVHHDKHHSRHTMKQLMMTLMLLSTKTLTRTIMKRYRKNNSFLQGWNGVCACCY